MKQWYLPPPDLQKQRQLSQALGILPLTAQLLINRGVVEIEPARAFLNPSLNHLVDPFSLPDMGKSVARILNATQQKESIGIYGDYDVDGLSATALLTLFFREIGISVISHIPERVKEGYGLNCSAMDRLKEKGVQLLITVDCGSTSHTELAHAKKTGLDVIVTDHHGIDALPPAFAVINPQRGEVGKELCGTGVAFFLIMALRQKMREGGLFKREEPNLKKYLDLVALATVADMVPVTGINRALVHFGLAELARTNKPGLIALKEICKLNANSIKTHDIGFRLGPRLNAGGRIAQPSLGLELLVTDNIERATALAKILDQCNSDRQIMQEDHLKEAFQQALSQEGNDFFLVHHEDWHPGIVGLVASKLAEKYFRPAIAFAKEGELLRGSARSIPGIHITEILAKTASYLEKFGGHAQAAGLQLSAERLDSFAADLAKALETHVPSKVFEPTLEIDAEVQLYELKPSLITEIERLRPFGIGNPEPLFACRNVQLKTPRVVGNNHWKLQISDNMIWLDAIRFGGGTELPAPGVADIAFVPQWNTYNGTTTIQLKIRDLQTLKD